MQILGVRNVLVFSLAAEGLTGLTVAAAPAFFSRLLFGVDVEGAGALYGRFLGISLVALVIACWPRARVAPAAAHAIAIYNLLAAGYLAYVGIVLSAAGVLLWPAAIEHALVALFLATGMRQDVSYRT